MMPLAHLWVGSKVIGRVNPLLTLGSILPDWGWVELSGIGKWKLDHEPMDFYKMVRTKFPRLLDLAIGVRLHSRYDRGADYYSEDPEIGYAVVKGRLIAEDVRRVFGLTRLANGIDISHDVIDAGVDLNVHDQYPEVWEEYKTQMKGINLKEVVECLAWYLHLDSEEVNQELDNFLKLLLPAHLASCRELSEHIALPLARDYLKSAPDIDSVIGLLEESKMMTCRFFEDWLNFAVENMKRDFVDII